MVNDCIQNKSWSLYDCFNRTEERRQSFNGMYFPADGVWLTFPLVITAQNSLLAGLLYNLKNLSTDHRKLFVPNLLQTGIRVHHHAVQNSDGPFKLLNSLISFIHYNLRHLTDSHGNDHQELKLNSEKNGQQ